LPTANSLSWRHDALASAITAHASELILRSLADRCRHLGIDPAIHAQLASSADAISMAWPAWRDIARQWDIISTGKSHDMDIAPVAADFSDLVLRTGRLAYRNPRWTPARADGNLARDPADLAATALDISTATAAVHHVSDIIICVAIHDIEAVRVAASDRTLYIPTRLLPEDCDIPCPYAPVPGSIAEELLGAYDVAVDASPRAAIVLDDLTVTTGGPSSMLAMTRAAVCPPVAVLQAAEDGSAREQSRAAQQPSVLPPHAGHAELILRGLRITEPAMLLRAAAIDQAARDLLEHAILPKTSQLPGIQARPRFSRTT
jgi:hypothetical protein